MAAMLAPSLLSGKHMGTESADRQPRSRLLQFKVRHYPATNSPATTLEMRWLVSSPCADAGATTSPTASPSAATPKARATVDRGIGFSLIEGLKGALLAQATCYSCLARGA